MPIRRIDITLPEGDTTTVEDLCGADVQAMDWSEFALSDGRRFMCLLLDADEIEAVLDRLHDRFEGKSDFRAAVIEVLARLPDPADQESEDAVEPAVPDGAPGDGGASDEAADEADEAESSSGADLA